MIDSLFDNAMFTASLTLLAAISLATFLISLILIPVVVTKLPKDCFLKLQSPPKKTQSFGPGRMAMLVLRNFFGATLLLAGFAMLFLPGQGLLTMLLGILLLSIPGKARLVLFLTASHSCRHTLDWLRKKSGKPPFIWPEPPSKDQGAGENGR